MESRDLPNNHFLRKNVEKAEFTDKKRGKLTLHSLIANHVLEMSVKFKFQCVRLKLEASFAMVLFSWFSICFPSGLFTRCDLYHTILLY